MLRIYRAAIDSREEEGIINCKSRLLNGLYSGLPVLYDLQEEE